MSEPGHPLVIRWYRPGDRDAVFALHDVGLAQVGIRPGDGIYYDHDLHRIDEVYFRDRGDFLVGEMDGRVVAMGGLRPGSDDVAEIVRMRVDPETQRRGYGAAILTRLERARELGYTSVRVDTTVKQRPALGLYLGYGYKEAARRVIGGVENVFGEKRPR